MLGGSSPASVAEVSWPPNARRPVGRGPLGADPEMPVWRLEGLFRFPRDLWFDARVEFSGVAAAEATSPFRAGASLLPSEWPFFGFPPLPVRPPRRPWLGLPLDDPCDGVCEGLPWLSGITWRTAMGDCLTSGDEDRGAGAGVC